MESLTAWSNFCVIVGSSAGALIGLQFVVMTLMAELPLSKGESESVGNAYATPTVAHFGAVLLVASIFSAPWEGALGPILLWGLVGASGVLYCLVIQRRQRSQKIYEPVLEDWLYYFILPILSYGLLLSSAIAAFWVPKNALFGAGAALLLLLFAGIHNAWDAITYGIFLGRELSKGKRKRRQKR